MKERVASRRARLGAWVFAAATGLAAPALAQRFVVEPPSGDVLLGQPLRIRLVELAPDQAVTISARRAIDTGRGRRLYRAEATFAGNPRGVIDLATEAPLAGSYRDADGRGLFWSMVPADDDAAAAALGNDAVEIEARVGDRTLARRTLVLRAAVPGLRWRDAAPFAGARLALPPAAPGERWPVIIALGGSEGDDAVLDRAGLLASHGFAVLGLPYYSPPRNGPNGPQPAKFPALPAAFAEIPVDRLDAARAWLAEQPEVDATRIALYGISKGAEFALIAATRLPWVRSVVAIAPSDVVWEGWGRGVERGQRASYSWRGQGLPFVPYVGFDEEFANFATGQPVLMRRFHDRGRMAPGAR